MHTTCTGNLYRQSLVDQVTKKQKHQAQQNSLG